MSGRSFRFLILIVCLLLVGVGSVAAQTSVPVKDDPLVRMPGTQPGQVSLESPNRCMNCHAGYNESVEPGFNWQGSMMAQSARDFLYFSCLTVAAQDSMWAIGNANATDICIRCHFPKGWLEGRSDPTNASLMTGADWDGVQCDFCHRMYDPFFEDTYTGDGVSADWSGYWDETNASDTPSQAAADATHAADATEAAALLTFNGNPFYDTLTNQPVGSNYTEATSGQYFVAADSAKRASFADADARHQMLYSRYHKSETMCATCHDVSNPILANLGANPAEYLPTEVNFAGSYFHVERTYSEFALSAYGQGDGAAGIGPFDPAAYETSNPGNVIARCQDCHMRDVVGAGADKNGAVVRPDGSVEHPGSGQPLHDLTGGNMWVPAVLASSVPGSPNYDATNDVLLNQGPAVLTLDLSQGQGIDPVALLAGADRAAQQLELAASITGVSYNSGSGDLTFRIQNQTGHKLISGFPEGRRVFVNIKGYSNGAVAYEVNPYDAAAETLKGLILYDYDGLGDVASPAPLGAHEVYVDELVIEMHPSSTLTGEAETFHFALGDGRYKDNRIPPMGFDIEGAAAREALPVWHGVEDPGYFTDEEYAGGYDEVSMTIPHGLDTVEIGLYYQTTSREYIEFLRDEIKGTGGTLSSPTPAGAAEAYVIQTDPFFDQLRAWGDTIWQLWVNTKDWPGAAPYLMTSATVGGTPPAGPPIPTLVSADPGQKQVTLTWSDEHTGSDPAITGYNVYYDQADKAQLVAGLGLETTYVDLNLTDGQTYCYKVTSFTDVGESAYSNIMCATPDSPGQIDTAGVTTLLTGVYETTGKGKNRVTTFVPTTSFAPGDTVIVRAEVFDSNGLPVEGATVHLSITGPESVTLVSGASDATGIAEASWTTEAPNRKGIGGTAQGGYTATVTGVAGTFPWDEVMTSTGFTLSTAEGAAAAN